MSGDAVPTTSERMAVVMARHLADGEVVIMGAVSALPQAACQLAQSTHAPHLSYIAGGSGAVNPRTVTVSSCDERLLDAPSVLPLPEVILLEGRGDVIDVFFAGGLQIDRYGNTNLVAVGDWHHPRLRGPGTVGLPFLPRAGRVVIYTMAHSPRTFVPRVDFVGGPGFLSGPAQWRAAGVPGGGPALVVTDLAVLDFDPGSLAMRLASVHPGVSVDQVTGATGFELVIPATVPVTPPPTATELAALRRVDPLGLLR